MNFKKIISLSISVAILLIIYSRIEIKELIKVFQNCDRFWMLISLGMVIPITLVTSWRLQQLVPKENCLGFGEANKLILGASVLNMLLPSKMGDIVKAYFMREKGNLSITLSLAIVIFEKAIDMLSLLFWCLFGLVLYPQKDFLFLVMTLCILGGIILGLCLLFWDKFANLFFRLSIALTPKKIANKIKEMKKSWKEMQDYFLGNRRNLTLIISTSIFLWFLHLLQIWLFIIALKAFVPFIISLALSPLSILAGLLPLTFAGIGTRDAALAFFYKPYLDTTLSAALGLLCTSRYFLPAIIGLPFLSQMSAAAIKIQQK